MIKVGFEEVCGVVCGGLWEVCGRFVVVCGVLWWFVVFSAIRPKGHFVALRFKYYFSLPLVQQENSSETVILKC